MRSHLREGMQTMSEPNQVSGLEIAMLIRLLANQYEALDDPQEPGDSLSGPRWGLLLRLVSEEARGKLDTTPTYLSRCQNVSKNTISSLLRGLEEQGLISRQLDAEDRRIFRIRLTPAGRSLIQTTAPRRIHWLNQLVGQLSQDDKTILVNLLTRLYRSIIEETRLLEVK
jgi:DNA-binding MarR family transcriptional regulator